MAEWLMQTTGLTAHELVPYVAIAFLGVIWFGWLPVWVMMFCRNTRWNWGSPLLSPLRLVSAEIRRKGEEYSRCNYCGR